MKTAVKLMEALVLISLSLSTYASDANINEEAAVVAEPSSLALLGFGIIGLAIARRKM